MSEQATSDEPPPDVIDWLLDPARSDPAIRWQVLRDLTDAPRSQWESERERIGHEGWGARLLAERDDDGQWAGGALFPPDFAWGGDEPGQPWTATSWALTQLREFGILPEQLGDTIELIGRHCRWEHADEPFWEGEVEPCINGRTVADGAYFGVDVSPIVERLLADRLDDGGWNCETERGSTVSSFDTTINVVEGLLAYEVATGGDRTVRETREGGEEYLLERGLFRRRSTGEAHEEFLQLTHPNRWRHDLLRGLDHLRAAAEATGGSPDPRLADAVAIVRDRQLEDGRWVRDWSPPGRRWLDLDAGDGLPSRWITLRALRVLRWWDGRR